MEIDTQQIEALLRQQEQQASSARSRSASSSFDEILMQQIGAVRTGANSAIPLPPGAAQAGLISQLLLSDSGAPVAANADEAVLQAAFEGASGALDLWDAYAMAVDSGQASDLRQAYGLLEGIDRQVASLKENTSGLRGLNPGLDSLLNELEVLAATEKVKFNRGDYQLQAI